MRYGHFIKQASVAVFLLMLCVVAALPMLALPMSAHAADDGRKVLLLNSYHPQYDWADKVTQGVVAGLSDVVPPEDIYVEYMDARRHLDDLVHFDNFHNLLAHKYRQIAPEVIVVSDDTALEYMLRKGREIFPDVPVVFSGVNVLDQHNLDLIPEITGIVEGMAIAENLDLILRILPNTKRVIMLADTSRLGAEMAMQAKAVISEWEQNPDKPKAKLDVWQDYSLAELKVKLSRLPEDTAVFILAIHKDNQGRYFSYTDDLDDLVNISAVPLWGMWGTMMLGQGVLGGMMNDGYSHGLTAGDMAAQILRGKPASEIPRLDARTVDGGYTPQFDFVELQRFKIDMDRLPHDSTIFGRPISFVEKYPVLVYGSLTAFVFLVMVIVVLIANIRNRAASEARLDSMNRNLEKIVELRTKELHDRNTSLQILNQDMKNLAHTDHLTGLGNRRSASEKLDALMQLVKATTQPFVVAMVDVDHFKNINDTYGHDVGDEALKVVAQTLRTGLRPNDMAFRWGGEEFLLVFVNTKLEAAHIACDRLRQAVVDVKTMQGYTLNVSMGLAEYREGEESRIFLHRADGALYAAKTSGRNRVVLSE